MSERSLGIVLQAWRNVEPINYGRVRAEQTEALLEFIEEPFKRAVSIMFEKHIPTVGSSCNINDYNNGYAWITVDYDFMTPRNRRIADRYETVEKATVHNHVIDKTVTLAGLLFPIEPLDLPEEIGAKAVDLAEAFHEQPNLLPHRI